MSHSSGILARLAGRADVDGLRLLEQSLRSTIDSGEGVTWLDEPC